MKVFIKTIILLLLIISIAIYSSIYREPSQDEGIIDKNTISKSEQQNSVSNNDSQETKSNPGTGLSAWIGKNAAELEESFGAPDRIDDSDFAYKWWIYNKDINNYCQFAVTEDSQIVSAFGAGNKADIAPFKIGSEFETVNPYVSIDGIVELDWQNAHYRFELSEQDIYTRPLIKLGDIFAQVYFDKFLGTISGVRFMDKQTLIFQKPYELTYTGTLYEPETPTDEEWESIEAANEKEIIDLTNVIRNQYQLPILEESDAISAVAKLHSKDMFENNYFSHISSDQKDLGNRLLDGDVPYLKAGENIAAKYVDSIAVVEGWLNSKSHREALLDKEFTLIGTGVYRKYYTQNFVMQQQ